MEASEIIEFVRQQHLTIGLSDDGHLELFPAEKITNELIKRLCKHKPEIVEELKREQTLHIELIRAWLFKIGEPESDHFLVINKCRNDPNASEYFLRHTYDEF